VEPAARREADTKVEALLNSAAWVCYLVLEWANEPFSLAASMSSVAELLEGRIDAAAVVLSHFPELGTDHKLLGLGHNADLTED
jgi:hypothetical protein